jgi:acyl-CoA synthetase (AMP-forming)/AMP-acid ligase II
MADVQIKIDQNSAQINDGDQESGEICCKRDYSFVECWDNQARPFGLEQINSEGWFGTRDLGRLLADGRIQVLGRSDHSIKRDGLLVLFADVETALQSIAGVEAAAVIAQGESLRGRGLTAYCVMSANSGLDSAAIRSQCFELLPKRAIPDKVFIIEALPLLSNGKIDRQALINREGSPSDN